MMKIHTIIISSDLSDSSHIGIVPSADNYVNGKSDTSDTHEISASNEESNCEDITEKDSKPQEKEKGTKIDYTSEYAYRLLSGKEKLEPSKEVSRNGVTLQSADSDDDVYVVPDASEREELLKSMYNLDQEPIFIPEEVRNRKYRKLNDDSPQQIKKAKMSEDESHAKEEQVDLETMLSTFVG